jgi:hypothetical protein
MSDTSAQTSLRPVRPRRRWPLAAAFTVAIALVAVAIGTSLARGHDIPSTPAEAVGGPRQGAPAAAPISAPTTAAPLPLEAATVTATFADPAVGRRLELTVLQVKGPDPRCVTHELRPSGALQHFVGVYYSACTDWVKLHEHIALFAVRIRNRSGQDVAWSRISFSILDRKGKRHRPTDVSSKAAKPSSMVRGKGSIGPYGDMEGLLAFRYTGHGWAPGELVFRDHGQRLVIALSGEIRRLGRS